MCVDFRSCIRSHEDTNCYYPDIFNSLVRRIPDVKNKFKPLEDRTEFKIWSKSLNLGLGMRKYSDKDGHQRVMVSTVLDKPLFDNIGDTVLYVG